MDEADRFPFDRQAFLTGVDLHQLRARGEFEQVGEENPGDGSKIQCEEIGEALVIDDQPVGSVDHAKRLRHIVQCRVETLVLDAEFAVTPLQDVVAGLQLRIDDPDFGIGAFEPRRGLPQVLSEAVQIGMGPPKLLVVQSQQQDQPGPEREKARHDAGKDPMELDQFALVFTDPVTAELIGGCRQLRQSRVERREQR